MTGLMLWCLRWYKGDWTDGGVLRWYKGDWTDGGVSKVVQG